MFEMSKNDLKREVMRLQTLLARSQAETREANERLIEMEEIANANGYRALNAERELERLRTGRGPTTNFDGIEA